MPEIIDFPLPFTVGIELEVCHFANPPRDAAAPVYSGRACSGLGLSDWRFKYDSSAKLDEDSEYGYELVSPILEGSYAKVLANVRNAVDWLKAHGASVNHNCGYHVHVGLNHLNKAQLAQIIAFLIRYERGFFALADTSRQENKYTRAIQPALIKRLRDTKKTDALPVQAWTSYNEEQDTDKYRWFNCLPFSSKGTVEFRVQEGTLDLNHIMGWIVFLSHAIDFVSKATDPRRAGKSKTEYPALSLHNLMARGGFYGAVCSDPLRAKLARDWATERFRKLHGYSHRARITETQAAKKLPAAVSPCEHAVASVFGSLIAE